MAKPKRKPITAKAFAIVKDGKFAASEDSPRMPYVYMSREDALMDCWFDAQIIEIEMLEVQRGKAKA